MAGKWFVSAEQESTSDSWETRFSVYDACEDIQLDCRAFYNADAHSCPQLRIDTIWLNGLVSIDVGGGPQSIVDFPYGGPMMQVHDEQVQDAIDVLLGRIQGTRFVYEYPDPEEQAERYTLNDYLDEAVDDVEEGSCWHKVSDQRWAR